MPPVMHSHRFKGVTTYVDGHLHLFSGISSVSPNVPGHRHFITGITTFNFAHSHPYNLITDTQTNVDSAHYHFYAGNTYEVLAHHHFIEETTFVFGE